jgi:hypothetical protein
MKSMSDYMNDLTGHSLDTLEQIISLQYRKFVQFYRLIEKYSNIINKVHYEFNSPLSLDVELEFNTKKTLETIKKELDESIKKNNYDGLITIKKKNIIISLVLDEEDDNKNKKSTKSK